MGVSIRFYFYTPNFGLAEAFALLSGCIPARA
jgi:hypothetical protein